MELTRISHFPGVEPDWEALERQDWHLWMLAVLLVFILGMSLLTFMFPTAFWFNHEAFQSAPQRAFFGFCVLLALVLVYMLQRQAAVRSLKRQLYQARIMAAAAEQESIKRVLGALPDIAQFQDSLAMEYLRASRSGGSLAAVFVAAPAATSSQLGIISFLLHTMLRPGESLFRVSPAAFGVILPAAAGSQATSFAEVLQDRLRNTCKAVEALVWVRAYPGEATSFTEFESLLRSIVEPAKIA